MCRRIGGNNNWIRFVILLGFIMFGDFLFIIIRFGLIARSWFFINKTCKPFS